MFTAQYLCPRQSPLWQTLNTHPTFRAALLEAQIFKPPNGWARVLGPGGEVLVQI